MKRISLLVAVLISCSTVVQAQQQRLVFATGTYKDMFTEIVGMCSDDNFQLTEFPSPTGTSAQNLDNLARNRVSAAFVRSDVIWAKAQVDHSYRQIKTLVTLYPEEIHVLALRRSNVQTWTDLAGSTMGATGDNAITAHVLSKDGRFTVREYASAEDVMTALDKGAIQVAIFVGAAPLSSVEQLSNARYRLLPISTPPFSVYRSITIDYKNLNDGASIPTLAAQALIVTKRGTTNQTISAQTRFRQCFYQHLNEFKETPGQHPKWQRVDANDRGLWDWYDIPTASDTRKP